MSSEITFGGWLKQRRKERGVGPDALAEQIGCSTIALLKIEAGERRPSRQMALLLAQSLAIPDDEQEAFVTFARRGQPAGTEQQSPWPSAVSPESLPDAPWRAAHLHKTNLPHALTPLIGRDKELEEAGNLLLQSRVRLLTLTGAPGIGKTRLALEIASHLLDHFEDGVFVVELATVDDPELVLSGAARALGLKESSHESIEETLFSYLKERRMLLVLDNFEHLLDAAPSVAKLLESSPWAKVLTTSREALHLRGERRYPVPPLGVPDRHQRQPLDVESLVAFPSVQLFVERTQAVDPDFALDEENGAEVAALCVALEGLPLAIELAATRTKHQSLQEMRRGLTSQLKLLTGGARDLPVRQRTLRNAIEWSYGLLNGEEQMLFRGLGVFVGGFTLEAAEAISKGEVEPNAVRNIVESLVDKSLLKEGGQIDRGGSRTGNARFGMLETIREYALEQLVAHGEEAETRQLHAAYFLDMAEAAEPELKGPNQQTGLARLDEENGNLQAALGWSLGVGEDTQTALRLSIALRRFWFVRGDAGDGRRWLEVALTRSESVAGDIRATALNAAGFLARQQGEHLAARPLIEESLAMYREVENKQGIASALNNLGFVIRALGEYAQARVLFEESLAIHKDLGDKHGIADALTGLGVVARTLDDQRAAAAFFEESLTVRRDVGDKLGIAGALGNLGLVLQDLGDLAEADALYEESLTLRRELGDQTGTATSLDFLGRNTIALGDYARACVLAEESLAMSRELGNKQGIADATYTMGMATYLMGNHEEGYAVMEKVISLFREIGEQGSVAAGLYEIGTLLYNQGDYKAAQARFDESLIIQRILGVKAGEVMALDGLGLVALHRGDFAAAHLYQKEALAICRELGYAINLARVLANTAVRAIEEGDLAQAREHYGELLPLLQAQGRREVIVACLEGLASLMLMEGRPQVAARLWGTVEAMRETGNYARAVPDVERYLRELAFARAQVEGAIFDAAWEEGRATSGQEALDYAEKTLVPPTSLVPK